MGTGGKQIRSRQVRDRSSDDGGFRFLCIFGLVSLGRSGRSFMMQYRSIYRYNSPTSILAISFVFLWAVLTCNFLFFPNTEYWSYNFETAITEDYPAAEPFPPGLCTTDRHPGHPAKPGTFLMEASVLSRVLYPLYLIAWRGRYLGKMLKPKGSMTFKHVIFINYGFCGGKRLVPAVV
ncbi:hypothetical protein P167DRAFT_190443 [Morchella conica CCBAS932]|uniref:Uncharacterized protein n=1 Tax=Morchella conica CCBAS932 TaxID=1392247 RepID=A0A3N4L1N4_9PEZI|nr:hypothetical protein P167DRAFT_190443 [Morchella conica CCBAS932]